MWSIALVFGSALLAGAVNAIAGGGTLLTFPSLLTLLGPVAANATSAAALLPGSISAALGYREELRRCRRQLALLLPPSLFGSIVGSLLLTRLEERVFAAVVPWLLVGASVLLLVQRPLMKYIGAHPHERPKASTAAAVVFFQFLVGIYGGYFGAGMGIVMLSSLAFMGIPDIHQMNGVKNVLAVMINSVAIVIFVLAGAIVWKYAAIMAVAAILGGYGGARIGRRMRPDYVRVIVVAIGFLTAAWSWAAL
jgi:uncharacterized membrane protein YfcA